VRARIMSPRPRFASLLLVHLLLAEAREETVQTTSARQRSRQLPRSSTHKLTGAGADTPLTYSFSCMRALGALGDHTARLVEQLHGHLMRALNEQVHMSGQRLPQAGGNADGDYDGSMSYDMWNPHVPPCPTCPLPQLVGTVKGDYEPTGIRLNQDDETSNVASAETSNVASALPSGSLAVGSDSAKGSDSAGASAGNSHEISKVDSPSDSDAPQHADAPQLDPATLAATVPQAVAIGAASAVLGFASVATVVAAATRRLGRQRGRLRMRTVRSLVAPAACASAAPAAKTGGVSTLAMSH